MPWTNYHSHCAYCDGSDAPAVYVEEAVNQGFTAYGFSSHAPLPFPTTWSMKMEKLPAYIAEVKALQSQYVSQIQIYAGLEVDFIPGLMGPKSKFIQAADLDYTVGSVHFVDTLPDGRHWEIDNKPAVFAEGWEQIFKKDTRAAVTRYFELTRQMVREQCPTLVGHLDKIKMQNTSTFYFAETEDWYQAEVVKTLREIAAAGVIVEVNTRGLYQNKTTEVYPGRWILAQMQQLNIPVTINSDAHKPSEIAGKFDYAAELLLETGYQQVQVLLDGEWQPVPLTSSGIQR
ncbi:histidinol-phosphatase [Adhaeribacter arboris]|uniref:Histidinol-phosphatase n=1 Tax=Adhaeribacter arboris TaxID=2072846 RepID=A0A2T2YK13_9BACT|nr:histidinol-phosphatase HisJ [Adhaeribacter arboris]PSR55851.1 histidinol-phosphatase [Adhaeribacter arboris]